VFGILDTSVMTLAKLLEWRYIILQWKDFLAQGVEEAEGKCCCSQRGREEEKGGGKSSPSIFSKKKKAAAAARVQAKLEAKKGKGKKAK